MGRDNTGGVREERPKLLPCPTRQQAAPWCAADTLRPTSLSSPGQTRGFLGLHADMCVTEHQLQEVQIPGVKVREGKEGALAWLQ